MSYLACLFNGIDLNGINPNISITAIDLHNRPDYKFQAPKLVRADGLKFVHAEFTQRSIIVTGFIATSDRPTYEANRDTLLLYLQPQESTLQFDQAGQSRQYTATVQNIIWTENQGGFATFDIAFLCSIPFGKDSSSTTVLNSVNITSASSTQNFNPIGGSVSVLPLITVKVNSLTGGTNKFIKFTNPATSKFITVTRNWNIGETLLVDCSLKTVTINGDAVDYTGTFPSFDIGATQLQYDDNLTTRTVSLSMTYSKRYM